MYEVLYEPQETFGGQIESNMMLVNEPVRSLLIGDLQEYINYTIFVRAYTSERAGPFSSDVTVLTLEDGKLHDIQTNNTWLM